MVAASLVVMVAAEEGSHPTTSGSTTGESTSSVVSTTSVSTANPPGNTTFDNVLRPLGTDGEVIYTAHDINLGLYMNSNVIYAGSQISVTVNEKSVADEADMVPSNDSWPFRGLALGPCGTADNPMGIAIFQGYFTSANISAAAPLQLYEPGTYECAATLPYVTAYSFQPQSDLAEIMQGSTSVFAYALNAVVNSSGYRSVPSGSVTSHAAFGNFPAGYYTVVGGDEWRG